MASILMRFSYSVVDGKNKGTDLNYYVLGDDSYTLNSVDGAARAFIPILRNLMNGGIKGGSISLAIDTSALYTSFPSIPIPDPDSDIEEGGEFVFYDAERHIFRNRIPTFDEALILTGTRQIDILDSRVVAYLDLILSGLAVGLDEYFVTGIRGQQIASNKSAEEDFNKSGKRKR